MDKFVNRKSGIRVKFDVTHREETEKLNKHKFLLCKLDIRRKNKLIFLDMLDIFEIKKQN